MYVPAIRTELVKNRIDIKWDYPEILWDKILGYNLLRSSKLKGQYAYLNKEMIKPETQHFQDESPLPVNYYKVEVVALNGKTIESFEALGQLEDSIPPGAPKGLTGKVNDNGVVTIRWKPNLEQDIHGYRVYRANNPDDEYVQVTREALKEPYFQDSINVDVLNEEIYYEVMALDNHFNPSVFSQVLVLQRPDKIPPSSPVFTDVTSYEDSIQLEWARSSSKDVESYLLFREYNNNFELLVELDSTAEVFVDKKVTKGETYGYYLQAKDDAGLYSESATIAVDALDDGIRSEIEKLKVAKKEDGIILSWQYQQVDRFMIYKAAGDSPLRLATSVDGNRFYYIDKQVEAGKEYKYAVKALFKNGAESPLTKPVVIQN